MIETRQKQERVILIGVALPNSENFDLSMEELASLAKTAGAEVVQTYTHKKETTMTVRVSLVQENYLKSSK